MHKVPRASVRRAPSLPPHLYLNLSPALRTPAWHILLERKGRTFLLRLWQRVEPIYGGAGGAEFSTLDWFVCFKSRVGSCGGGVSFSNYTHRHARARTRTDTRSPCPPGSPPAPPGYSSPFPEHQLALLAQSPVATTVASAAAGTAGAGARGPGLRWAPVFLSSLFPSPRLIDDHQRPMALTPRHPRSSITAPRPRRQPRGRTGIPEPSEPSRRPEPSPPPPRSLPDAAGPFPVAAEKRREGASKRWKGVWRLRIPPL